MSHPFLHQLFVAFLLPMASAQTLIDPARVQAVIAHVPPDATDATHQSLICQVAAIKPLLNLGLRLQAGYIFRFPLSQYSGSGHNLTVLTTITPDSASRPVYLLDRLRLPPVPQTDADYEASGSFFLGEGHYHINWLLFDDTGRTCRKKWDVNAELGRAGRDVKLVTPPNSVTDVSLRAFSTPSRRTTAVAPKRLTVLLDAAPLSTSPAVGSLGNSASGGLARMEGGGALPLLPADVGARAAFQRGGIGGERGTLDRMPAATRPFELGDVSGRVLRSSDQVLLLGALSALLEHLPVAAVRLVVFNLEQHKELFRSENFGLESLNDVARTLNQIQLAKVDYQVLLDRTGHIDLLAQLINRELRAKPPSDIVVFLGPRERFHDKFPDRVLDKRRGSRPRFFFLAYQLPVPLLSVPHAGERDVSFGGIDLPDGPQPERSMRRSGDLIITTAPEGLVDTLSRAIGKLKGKTMTVESPRQFAKAIREIDRLASR